VVDWKRVLMAKLAVDQREIRLSLSGDVAREAEAQGLLDSASLEALLREELRRRRVDRLFEAADRLAALPGSPLSEAELNAEIAAVRSRRSAIGPGASGR
jgi:hypothetical protein